MTVSPTARDQPTSWSMVPAHPYYNFSYWIQPNTTAAYSTVACPDGPSKATPCGPCPGPGKPSSPGVLGSDTWCAVDEPDEHFYDHGLASNTIERIEYAAGLYRTNRTPFFLQSGFARPHMPQRMPARFWELYKTEELPLPAHPLPPDDMPGIAYFKFGFYNSSNGYVWPLDIDRKVPDWATAHMRHAYYASVSWLDFQVKPVPRHDLCRTPLPLWSVLQSDIGEGVSR